MFFWLENKGIPGSLLGSMLNYLFDEVYDVRFEQGLVHKTHQNL